jgi:hypothetical protein
MRFIDSSIIKSVFQKSQILYLWTIQISIITFLWADIGKIHFIFAKQQKTRNDFYLKFHSNKHKFFRQ